MTNLEIWNKLSRPPKEALKEIGGGRLKGMTDVNPQWRIKAMTEQFGAIGFGWKYSIVERWKEEYNDQVACFVRIVLFVKEGQVWSEAIEGVGGSMLLTREKNGMYFSDEGYKMALTDALSVAMKQLGVAADIYAGLWDGSKFRDVKDPVSPFKETIKPDAKKLTTEEVKENIKTVCSEYMTIHEKEVPEGMYILPKKFEAAIKKVATKMTNKELNAMTWGIDDIKMLALMVNITDTLEKVPD